MSLYSHGLLRTIPHTCFPSPYIFAYFLDNVSRAMRTGQLRATDLPF